MPLEDDDLVALDAGGFVDRLGIEEINRDFKRLGLENTVLEKKILDFEAKKAGRDNFTTAADTACILQTLHSGEELPPGYRARAMDILSAQKLNNKLPGLIPVDDPDDLEQILAHKTGELPGIEHDAGIFFFKYFNFGVDSLNGLGQAFGIPGLQLDLAFRITLPLGISFYTFQSMSYTIDVFRGHARPIRNFIDFACYVSMFPQLVAGPIIRFQEVSEQLRQRSHTLEKFARGSAFLAMGLAKKVLLANPCGKVADTVFDAGSVGILESWYGLFAYAFQIYFDFSAYSDMAIGLGLMLGFVFAKNFDSPYCSRSITEFWRH